MYLMAQDKRTLINLDNFHEVFLDDESLMIVARVFSDNKNLTIILGQYKDIETAKNEFSDFQESLLDDEVAIHEFD